MADLSSQRFRHIGSGSQNQEFDRPTKKMMPFSQDGCRTDSIPTTLKGRIGSCHSCPAPVGSAKGHLPEGTEGNTFYIIIVLEKYY